MRSLWKSGVFEVKFNFRFAFTALPRWTWKMMPSISTLYTPTRFVQTCSDASSGIDRCVRDPYPIFVENDVQHRGNSDSETDADCVVNDSDVDDDCSSKSDSVLYSRGRPADVEKLAVANILKMTEGEMVSTLNGDEEAMEDFVADIRDVLVSSANSDETRRAKQRIVEFILSQSTQFKSEIFGSGAWSCNFVGLDLRGFDFSGIGFRGADFSNSDLSGANFSGAGLVNAKFNGANLSGAVLKDTLLWRGKFVGANLSHVDFGGADLLGVEMHKANLQGAKLNVKSMSSAKFVGADLRGADFTGGDLRLAEFSGANLENARFKGMLLTDVDFIGANLRNADFGDVDLRYTNLSKAILIGASFDGGSLKGANLSGADLREVSFIGLDLYSSDFTGANLSHANFKGMDLFGLHLDGANLSDVDFSDANLGGIVFGRANLSRANFEGANVQWARFSLDSNVDKKLFELSGRIGNSFVVTSLRVLPQKLKPQSTLQLAVVKTAPQLPPGTIQVATAPNATTPPKTVVVAMPKKLPDSRPTPPQKLPITPNSFWSWISGITFGLRSFLRSIQVRLWGSR